MAMPDSLVGIRFLMDGYFDHHLHTHAAIRFLMQLPRALHMQRINFPYVHETDMTLDGIVIIAESHIAIHQLYIPDVLHYLWQGTVDISTCKPQSLDRKVIDSMALEILGFHKIQWREIPWHVESKVINEGMV